MEYPKLLFGKFCTMIRHEQSVWTLNSKLPYARSKLVRKEISRENWKSFTSPYYYFFPQIGTGVYHWNPPIKQESMQWVHKVRFPPKKAKTQSSGGKRMATILGRGRDSAYWKMVKDTIINGEVYLKTIWRLKGALKLKRPSSWRQKNLLLSGTSMSIVRVIKKINYFFFKRP
jgi:hypothetical protein